MTMNKCALRDRHVMYFTKIVIFGNKSPCITLEQIPLKLQSALPDIFSGKTFLNREKKLKKNDFYKSTNIFKGNTACPMLLLSCFLYPGLIKYTIFYLKMLIFRVIVIKKNFYSEFCRNN